MHCQTHHEACECREHNFAMLTKVTQELLIEIDWLKNKAGEEEQKELIALIARGYVCTDAVQLASTTISPEFATRLAGFCSAAETALDHALRHA